MRLDNLKKHILAYTVKYGKDFKIINIGPVGDEQSLSVSDGIMSLDYRITPLTARLFFEIRDGDTKTVEQCVAMLRSDADNAISNFIIGVCGDTHDVDGDLEEMFKERGIVLDKDGAKLEVV